MKKEKILEYGLKGLLSVYHIGVLALIWSLKVVAPAEKKEEKNDESSN